MTTGKVVMISAATTVLGAILARKFGLSAPGFNR